MGKNIISKILFSVGIIEFVCGIFIFLVLSDDNFLIGLPFLIMGIIFGIIFVGFSEIINLLQDNVDNQNEMLRMMKDKKTTVNDKTKSMIQDIESNLPEM
ncbi:hypothetical protein CYL18_04595 [Pradoshia eiseniae]|uniref:Uncharacterized protein n=2 Tax=Pradoshia eiseniae TaxID=2064768 RepID=A0A2S7N554_9BACI|nr:hypothetical protein CYL18_04595 [Pradoshia eiseniae]